MSEVLEEEYTYKDISTLIHYIYGIIQAEHYWFKEYIKTITPKSGIEKNARLVLVFYTESINSVQQF